MWRFRGKKCSRAQTLRPIIFLPQSPIKRALHRNLWNLSVFRKIVVIYSSMVLTIGDLKVIFFSW